MSVNNVHVYPEGCYFKSLEDIKDKHVTVMGLGLNGGGEAVVRFLLKHGAYVLVTDMKSAEELTPTLEALAKDTSLDKSHLSYVLGQHRIEDFESADCVIKNPGIKYNGNKYLEKAKAIETDLSIFLHFTKAPIIAVTGSKGKSTTVSAIHYGLNKAGFKAFLGGNITVSPLTFLDQTDGTTPVVLELSSWQLADLRGRKLLKPHIAVITKIVPDHQNWYGNMLSYVEDKKLIFENQTKDDYTILDYDSDSSAEGVDFDGNATGIENWGNVFAKETKATVLRYSRFPLNERVYGAWLDKTDSGIIRLPENLLSKRTIEKGLKEEVVLKELKVPGPHARINSLNAALVLRLMGVAPEAVREIMSEWTGIEHRLEYFHTWEIMSTNNSKTHKKAVFYNDSCATVPEATVAALQSFKKKVVLLTGGTDKKLDFKPLVKALISQTTQPEELYLLAGTGTDKLTALLDKHSYPYHGPYASLEAALATIKSHLVAKAMNPKSNEETIVVFSPGATSFGMFKNEFDRGNTYKEDVKVMFV